MVGRAGTMLQVSTIVEFFIAPDDRSAAAVLDGGPGRVFESVEDYGNFMPFEAMVEWESILTGRSEEELLEAGEPRDVADHGPDGGCMVFAASSVLQDGLAGLDQAGLSEMCARWIQLRQEDGEDWDTELVNNMFGDLADLARTANRQALTLYCWMA
jgi:hypothetical protein